MFKYVRCNRVVKVKCVNVLIVRNLNNVLILLTDLLELLNIYTYISKYFLTQGISGSYISIVLK